MSNAETVSVAGSEYVTIISSDGHEFIIKRKFAMTSKTIAALLSGPAGEDEVHLRDMPFYILKDICRYFLHNVYYAGVKDAPDFNVNPETALEMIYAADLLEC